MSTYYQHTKGANIIDLAKEHGFTAGNAEGIYDTIEEAVAEGYFNITDGSNFSWIETDVDGTIMSFKRYGANDVSFIRALIGGISEYDLGEVYQDFEITEPDEDDCEFDFDGAMNAIANGDYDYLIEY